MEEIARLAPDLHQASVQASGVGARICEGSRPLLHPRKIASIGKAGCRGCRGMRSIYEGRGPVARRHSRGGQNPKSGLVTYGLVPRRNCAVMCCRPDRHTLSFLTLTLTHNRNRNHDLGNLGEATRFFLKGLTEGLPDCNNQMLVTHERNVTNDLLAGDQGSV